MISLALVVGGGVGAALPAMAAVGQSSSPPSSAISILSPGTLLARGAVADVSVRVMCQPGDFVIISYALTERSQRIVISGSGNASFTCTETPQSVTMALVAFSYGPPFAAGSAYAQASFVDCPPSLPCTFTNTAATIKLKK
jgi:hypothetical protein